MAISSHALVPTLSDIDLAVLREHGSGFAGAKRLSDFRFDSAGEARQAGFVMVRPGEPGRHPSLWVHPDELEAALAHAYAQDPSRPDAQRGQALRQVLSRHGLHRQSHPREPRWWQVRSLDLLALAHGAVPAAPPLRVSLRRPCDPDLSAALEAAWSVCNPRALQAPLAHADLAESGWRSCEDQLRSALGELLAHQIDQFRAAFASLTTGVHDLETLCVALRSTVESLQRALAHEHRLRDASERLHLSHYPQLFPAARRQPRLIHAFVGEPNSGKTHAALDRLAAVIDAGGEGAYLGPLRLLALEGQESMVRRGVRCSLVTGEERELVDGARCTSSTIEMLDCSRSYDCVVVDEYQMAFDRDRGWAWTQALVGCAARELLLVGAAWALEPIFGLLRSLGDSIEVHEFQRKTPLRPGARAVSLAELQPGDALVAFSRRDVLGFKHLLEARSRRVAVIYGALSPEVRRREAGRFSGGQADILVATDAIGMGLNLPIRRIVFSSLTKWDGQNDRTLTASEFHQIAGRAGRFGHFEAGEVTTLADCVPHLGLLRKLMSESPAAPADLRLPVAPNWMHLQELSTCFEMQDMAQLLDLFCAQLQLGDRAYKTAPMEDAQFLAAQVLPAPHRFGQLSLRDAFVYTTAPAGQRPLELWQTLRAWIAQHAAGDPVRAPDAWRLLTRRPPNAARLEEAETELKIMSLYGWLQQRFAQAYPDAEEARRARNDLDRFIEACLHEREQQRRRGRSKSTH